MISSRDKLLDVAFDEIYHNGYTATSIDKILKQASMNKGSMYHYFKSKKELGLAVVNEKVNSYIEDKYSVLLKHEDNICDEVESDSWGFEGLTQEYRYIKGKK